MKIKLRALTIATMAISLSIPMFPTTVFAQLISGDDLANTKQEAVSLADDLPATAAPLVAEVVTKDPDFLQSPVVSASDNVTETTETVSQVLHVNQTASKAPVGAEGSGTTPNGEIVVLNAKKNFVIVDFYLTKVPAEGTELFVYREDQIVGMVHLTKPIKPPLASADILKGTLQRGDIVR